MKNSYKTLAFALVASFLFAHCSADKQRNRDIPYNDLETVMANLSPLAQSFEIDPTEDNQIKGKKGTVVFIPADAFRFEDGSAPTGEVQVELKESYTLTEMIGAGLHTMSGNRPLETAGMIYVNASADGRPLTVQDGKAFVVSFPKNQQTEDMDLFYSLALMDSVETWVVDYEVFGVEKRLEAMSDTLNSSVDSGFVGFYDKYENSDVRSVYPFELTEDLYDTLWSSYLHIIIDNDEVQKEYESLIHFIEDKMNQDYKDVFMPCSANDPYFAISFNLDSKGKIFNVRPAFQDATLMIDESDEMFKNIKIILENAPSIKLSGRYKSGIDDLIIGICSTVKLDQDRFKQKFRNQNADIVNKAIDKIDRRDLDFYTFAVTKLGWINCDRFLDMDASELTNFAVNTASPNTANVRLIFKDLNSIMQGAYEDGKIVFANSPKGKAVKLVGISYADGKPMMATAETVIGEKGFELTGYKPFTLDEMEAALNN